VVVVVRAADAVDGLGPLLTLLATELAAPRAGGESAVTSLLDLVLVHLVRAALDRAPTAAAAIGHGGWPEALRDPIVGAALQAIHAAPTEAWTVAALADVAGASRSVFAERFSRLVGRPVLAYITWWRMTTAARLLTADADERVSVASVARQVGYRSEFAFAKAFKRQQGLTPGQWRQEHRLRATTGSASPSAQPSHNS
jgi:AraC-like DNA-binding protein